MSKKIVTRYACDAPDCTDTADVEGPPATATLQPQGAPSALPDGWVEFALTGSTPGGDAQLVHASTPECAAALASDQVEKARGVAADRVEKEKKEREEAERAQEVAREAELEQASAQEPPPPEVSEAAKAAPDQEDGKAE